MQIYKSKHLYASVLFQKSQYWRLKSKKSKDFMRKIGKRIDIHTVHSKEREKGYFAYNDTSVFTST